jgi:3-hydroxyacyl-CoA dehydrogenase
MANRQIKKVAVLGSGVMGSRIACLFANVGAEVLLLDIVPKEAVDSKDKTARNKIVNDALAFALKSNPSPIYDKRFAKRISTGNFDDDLPKIKDCDWIIEVVIERLDIKQQVYTNVENYRTPGTLITTNTSGIPIHALLEGRSDDFAKHFLGTHFFNPPRYLPLLELIPSPKTDPAVIAFLEEYGRRVLGKVTVRAKDTPAFVANRIGVFGIMDIFHLINDMGLSVEEVDRLTGPVIGHPKSATFRTADVVGLDTLVNVAKGVQDNCPKDERNDLFAFRSTSRKWWRSRCSAARPARAFTSRTAVVKKGEILSLDLKTLEYKPQVKPKFATLDAAKKVDDLRERTKLVYHGTDKAGEFYRRSFQAMFAYVSNRIPEISDELYRIDDGMRAGFGWELGPFETWEAIGVKEVLGRYGKGRCPRRALGEGFRSRWEHAVLQTRRRQAAVLRHPQQELQAGAGPRRSDRAGRPAGKQHRLEEQGRHRARPRRRHPRRELEQQDEHLRRGGDPRPQQSHRPRRSRATRASWSTTTARSSAPAPTWA